MSAARISFQLTPPSRPTVSDSEMLVDDLSSYISNGFSPPTFVQEGVAQEAAVALVVSAAWLNNGSESSDYITRRSLIRTYFLIL